MDIQNRISLSIHEGWRGKTVEVMAEGPTEKDSRIWSGRTRGNKLVLWPQGEGTEGGEGCLRPVVPGQLVHVLITNPQTWLLKGRRVD